MKHAITKATRQWCARAATRCIGGDVTARKWTHAMAGGRPVIRPVQGGRGSHV
mgnify:CR=1 FL=1